MFSRKVAHHRAGGWPGAKSTPPMPSFTASTEPITSELQGMVTGVQHPAQDFFMLTPSSFTFRSFFSEIAYLHCAVISSSCEKIQSTACMMHLQTFWQWQQEEPWAILMKSLTNTSMCTIGPWCLMSRAWSSGCGNGHGRSTEICLAVSRLMGGCSPRIVSGDDSQQL